MSKNLIDLVGDANSMLRVISSPLFSFNDLLRLFGKEEKSRLIAVDSKFAVHSGIFRTEGEYLSVQYNIASPSDATTEHVATCLSKMLFCNSFDEGFSDELDAIVKPLEKIIESPTSCAHLMSRRSFVENFSRHCINKAKDIQSEIRHYARKSEWSEVETEEIALLDAYLSSYDRGILLSDIESLALLHEKAQIKERHPLYAATYQLVIPEQNLNNVVDPIDELIMESTKHPALIYKLKPRDFEKYIAQIWGEFGFDVELTSQTRDGGADIICMANTLGVPYKVAIEVKRYADNRPISVELVRSFIGANSALRANKLVYVTSSRFTRDAKNFAMSPSLTNLIELCELPDILRWANEFTDKKKGLGS